MAHGGRTTRWLAGLLLVGLLAAGAVGWTQRQTLLAWYHVRALTRAGEESRDALADRAAGLGEPAVPALLTGLTNPDPTACGNVGLALARLARTWGAEPRGVALVGRLADGFAGLSAPGKQAALEAAVGALPERGAAPPELLTPCARLLEEAAGVADPAITRAALALGGALLRPSTAEVNHAAAGVVRAALECEDPENRAEAVRLSSRCPEDLLPAVVARLHDASPEVRRAAYLCVGPYDQVARDEALLPGLHDPDAGVRRQCEEVLRGRGLQPEHLLLGRLLTDPRPGQRLQVLDQLGRVSDVDPGLWLRRLSHDSSPAVRAAALRAMSQQDLVDLTDRLDQMARSDPSPTVCQLAHYYLRHHRPAGVRHAER